MRRIHALFQGGCEPLAHRVVDFDDLASQWEPHLRFLVLVTSGEQRRVVEAMGEGVQGLANLYWTESDGIQAGDVLVPLASREEALVLLRASDAHHALFMTNRCNSYCLMCSQPPTASDDSWLVDEAIEAIRHLGWAPRVLGLTGGEPLLLGNGLRRVLDAAALHLPGTRVEVLTNGRLFGDKRIATDLLQGLDMDVRWLVPLYGHADFVHDFIVQSPGAFEETLAGLLMLQDLKQDVQLRTVLIEPVLQVLPELAGFVGRNLPFVRELAWMGCEPTGFALANRVMCEVDLNAWGSTLEKASSVLRRHAVPQLFMNLPLCVLPSPLWPLAHRSISDWKNVYAPECLGCSVKDQCAGLFAWHEKGWKPAPLKAFEPTEATP
jgi:His-Xaa-Ser system radical SAM maturase HxsC